MPLERLRISSLSCKFIFIFVARVTLILYNSGTRVRPLIVVVPMSPFFSDKLLVLFPHSAAPCLLYSANAPDICCGRPLFAPNPCCRRFTFVTSMIMVVRSPTSVFGVRQSRPRRRRSRRWSSRCWRRTMRMTSSTAASCSSTLATRARW